jgi:hypothetical protein
MNDPHPESLHHETQRSGRWKDSLHRQEWRSVLFLSDSYSFSSLSNWRASLMATQFAMIISSTVLILE